MTQSADEAPVRAHILVVGRVQGVGFRAFAARSAVQLGLSGGVRNLDDGRVELEVEGGRTVIEALLRELKIGSPASHVGRIDVEWSVATGRYSRFDIWY
ncbi:acylphosphatase [Candidatus Nitrospira nitrificans]|uniref:acylphosphatase n=1 Tax=Candidatus Nitrospira nitrificans TaxID=1742973 RepID=A0A0S4L9D4_9BACT|nr:acylphosphatase [Candidatus Nitrospira nitrificans]CUS33438.1 Acylphosphatase [Candidatus Nitrospira nitrificans]